MALHKLAAIALMAGSAIALTSPVSAAPPQQHHNNMRPVPGAWRGGLRTRSSTFVFRGRISGFSPAARAAWVHGHWHHGWHNGHFGWWWWTGGGWYFYDTPIYPYPDYASDVYYDDDDGYSPGYGDGAYWYWCSSPRGYYPYIQSCNGPWQPVPAGAGPQQGGPAATAPGDEANGPPQDMQNGPPPQDDESGPPPGYGNGDQNGPPPGYGNDDQNGPPPGYGNGPDDQGQGDDEDNGPDDQNGPPPDDQYGPPPGYSGSPQ